MFFFFGAAFISFRSFCENMNSSESWWNACSSDWEWPLKGVQSYFFQKLQTKTEEVKGQKRERMGEEESSEKEGRC